MEASLINSETSSAISQLEFMKTELLESSKIGQRVRTIENVWVTLVRCLHNQEDITIARVGKLCIERFGGPRPQSISNDQAGLAKLVRAFARAQTMDKGRPKHPPRPNHGKKRTEIVDSLVNPRIKSLVHEIFDEAASLRAELQITKALLRKAQVNRQGEVTIFAPPEITNEQRIAISKFLYSDLLYQVGLNLTHDEVRTQRGITVFGRESVLALKKIISGSETTQ